ncbi:hypothetical protein FIBSPDRAFT_473475 [Athelia psychrophila]|uniref:Uncharacterized protein n=1 Tax=Athelia psychrophila TaxID=1759441 RepID=A0A167U0D4_9AGAM|nr:hypothetical protein FIBSPDRAFT_473475 [Fibularhizoctonia sp. CBS 109695]
MSTMILVLVLETLMAMVKRRKSWRRHPSTRGTPFNTNDTILLLYFFQACRTPSSLVIVSLSTTYTFSLYIFFSFPLLARMCCPLSLALFT